MGSVDDKETDLNDALFVLQRYEIVLIVIQLASLF